MDDEATNDSPQMWPGMISAPLDMAQMDELVVKSVNAWTIYDQQKALAGVAYAEAEKIDREILAALNAAGKSKYFVDGVGTISTVRKSVVRIPNTLEAKKEFFEFLRSKGEEVFLSFATVNSNALNAWYNIELADSLSRGVLGFSVPGIEQPTDRESLRFTKDKHGKKTSS